MAMNVKIAIIMVIDFDNGSIILKIILNSEQPSIRAASIRDCGTVLKNWVKEEENCPRTDHKRRHHSLSEVVPAGMVFQSIRESGCNEFHSSTILLSNFDSSKLGAVQYDTSLVLFLSFDERQDMTIVVTVINSTVKHLNWISLFLSTIH